MSLGEAFALRDTFIQYLSFTVSTVPPGVASLKFRGIDIPSQDLIDCHASLPRFSNSDGTHLVLLQTREAGYQSGRCPANVDGSCSIHEKRPTICRSVPFASLIPDAYQRDILLEFGARFGCITNDGGGGMASDGLEANRAAIHEDAEAMARIIEMMTQGSNPTLSLDTLLQHGNRISLGPLAVAMALSVYRDLKHIEDDLGTIFLESQIELMRAEVDKAVKRKNREDIPKTRELRKFIDEGSSFLKSGT